MKCHFPFIPIVGTISNEKKEEIKGDVFSTIPLDLISEIFSYLTIRDLISMQQLNKEWKKISINELRHSESIKFRSFIKFLKKKINFKTYPLVLQELKLLEIQGVGLIESNQDLKKMTVVCLEILSKLPAEELKALLFLESKSEQWTSLTFPKNWKWTKMLTCASAISSLKSLEKIEISEENQLIEYEQFLSPSIMDADLTLYYIHNYLSRAQLNLKAECAAELEELWQDLKNWKSLILSGDLIFTSSLSLKGDPERFYCYSCNFIKLIEDVNLSPHCRFGLLLYLWQQANLICSEEQLERLIEQCAAQLKTIPEGELNGELFMLQGYFEFLSNQLFFFFDQTPEKIGKEVDLKLATSKKKFLLLREKEFTNYTEVNSKVGSRSPNSLKFIPHTTSKTLA